MISALVVIVATVAVVGAAALVALQVRQDRRAQHLVPRPPRVATGATVRLACCAAPDVPRGAAYCIRCGKQVQP